MADYLQSLFTQYPEFASDLRKTGKIDTIETSDDFRREYTKWTDRRYAKDARPNHAAPAQVAMQPPSAAEWLEAAAVVLTILVGGTALVMSVL